MVLVVGLGNPGRKYASTRHNIGFGVVDRLGERWGFAVTRSQSGCLVGDGMVRSTRAFFAKPQKYMNRSGVPVRGLMDFYKLEAPNVLVVHDEIELAFGRIKIKRGGGHGGHNGLRDLNRHVGRDYPRVRFGVGRPPAGWDTADYVLSKWTGEEADALPTFIERACDAVEAVLGDGIEAAMNEFNGVPGSIGGAKGPEADEQAESESSES